MPSVQSRQYPRDALTNGGLGHADAANGHKKDWAGQLQASTAEFPVVNDAIPAALFAPW
jgi:hypothetical protein